MKNSYLALIVVLIFISCSDGSNESNQSFDTKGTFEHTIPNCDNGGNSEMNCTEIITFIDDSSVDVLIGGGDIMYRAEYLYVNSKIDIDWSNMNISLNVKNDSTLVDIGSGEIWTKSK
jgi:hypothetical protein